MRRTTRTAAGALALAVALGAGSPVAASAATGHDKTAHVNAEKSNGNKSDKGQKGKTHKVAQQLRQVLRDIDKADERLERAARESRTSRIGDYAAAVLVNVAADRAALAELATAVQAADSILDLRVVRKELRNVREQNYNKVINDLRHALELGAEIAEARLALVDDATAPVGDLETAQLALDAAVAKALLVTASSTKAELRAVKADLEAAHVAFEVVRAYLESAATEDDSTDDDSTEDEVEEEVEDEVVEEPPVEEDPLG